jgi:PTH2 family peptidyl-tRNA hydrolase
MRKGKMVAQGAHASLGAYLTALTEDIFNWSNNGQTKICVGVDSEQELIDVYHYAKMENLPTYLVLDAGKTEFKESTYTTVAIGPAKSEEIDKITGNLKLL